MEKFLRRYVVFLCLIFPAFSAFCQDSTAVISGQVKNTAGEPLPFINLVIKGKTTGAVSDEKGGFTIANVAAGEYELAVSGVGYQSASVKIRVPEKFLTIILKAPKDLREVEITEKTQATRINESPMAVKAIDLKPLQGRALSVQEVLSQTAGVKVRQTGGFGSVANITVNGLSGKAIKYFIDGVPLEYQGFGISKGINNLPVNLIDRVEIYKGVVPIQFGADALGGVINIVTKQRAGSYAEVSSEYGSLDTWRNTLSLRQSHEKTGLYIAFNGYQNYTNNNFRIQVGNRNVKTFQFDTIDVNRFHDRFRSYGLNLEVGIRNKKWARMLSFSQHRVQADKQLQNPLTNYNQVLGQTLIKEDGVVSEAKYLLDSVVGLPLSISAYAGYVNFTTALIDTSHSIYDWYGNVVGQKPGLGGELGYSALNSRIHTKSNIYRANATYTILPGQLLSISGLQTYAFRTGSDTTAKKFYGVDPFANSQNVQKTILGIAYESSWLNHRVRNVVSGKYYGIKGTGNDGLDFMPRPIPFQKSIRGWNEAISIAVIPKRLRVKASFEAASRLPEETELFGNGVFISSNPNLVPETSRNANLGFVGDLGKNPVIHLEVNYFIRKVENMIQLVPYFKNLRYTNIARVEVKGVEAEIRVIPVKWLQLDFNITSFDSRNRTDTNNPASNTVQDKQNFNSHIPNTPMFYYNSGVTFTKTGVLGGENRLQLFWYVNYSRKYYLAPETNGLASTKFSIPSQFVASAGINYGFQNNRASIGLEVHNYNNVRVIDFFGIQNPGRTYHLKIRYSI